MFPNLIIDLKSQINTTEKYEHKNLIFNRFNIIYENKVQHLFIKVMSNKIIIICKTIFQFQDVIIDRFII